MPYISSSDRLGALEATLKGPRAEYWLLAQRRSLFSGTGVTGFVSAKPGQPAITEAKRTNAALVLIPPKTVGDPFTSSLV